MYIVSVLLCSHYYMCIFFKERTSNKLEPHRWWNGDRFECGRIWVRVPIGSIQRLKNRYVLLLR